MKPFLRQLLRATQSSVVLAMIVATSRAQTAESAQTVAVPSRITHPVDDSQRVTLRGNVHPLARPEFDRGPVAADMQMNRMLLVLRRSDEQEQALQQLLAEQMDKGSLSFHKWLSPEEFGRRFGPSDDDIKVISDWLHARGFSGVKVGVGRTNVEFSGDVAALRNAFHTDVRQFVVKGQVHHANSSDPEIPDALSPVVAGIVSLHDFRRKSLRHSLGNMVRMTDGRIIPDFTGSTNQFFAVGPADFATIYNIPASLNLDGTGVTIAVIGTSNINLQDVSDYRNFFGLTPSNNVVVVPNGPLPDLNSEEGEADLDLQISGAVAPGASIKFIATEDTASASGVDLGSVYVIDNNAADILSLSFGDCEADLQTSGNSFFRALWQQAAAQGITVTVSSGDNGSAGCDDFTTAKAASKGLAVSGIASTPYNIAVGGTDFDDVGNQAAFWNQNPGANAPVTRLSAKGYIPETTWNDSCAATATPAALTTCVSPSSTLANIVAASGGPSSVNAKPAYQTALTPVDAARDIPDVSLFASDGQASKSFYLVCQADAPHQPTDPPSCASSGSFRFQGAGGTSASAPAFAGIMALIDQKMGGRQGNANFVLYKVAATPGASCNSSTQPLNGSTCAFNDVTKGNISVPCTGNSTTNCSSATAGTNGVLVTTSGTTKTPAFTTGAGYDLATGLGSVNVANLAAAWPTAVGTFKGSATSLKLNGNTTLVQITHGTSVTATAAVAANPGPGTPSGDVSLLAATSVNGGVAAGTLSGGIATINTAALPGGAYNIVAHYAGDGTFAPSDSNPVPVQVSQENSRLQIGMVSFNPTSGAVTNANATTLAYGSPYVLRADILNGSGGACAPLVSGGSVSGCAFDATGTVTITDNGAPLDIGSFPVNSGGFAEDQPIQLPPGSHQLVANYSGDISFKLAGPVTDTVTITQATSTMALTATPSSIVKSGSVTLTAVVSTTSSGAAPTGTVKFTNGGVAIAGTVTFTPVAGSATSTAKLTATLTTTLSAIAPPPAAPWRPGPPLAPYQWILLIAALLLLAAVAWRRPRRRTFAYTGIALAVLLVGGAAGCGGGGGGGTTVRTLNLSASYSGDANYTSSSANTSVTVQ